MQSSFKYTHTHTHTQVNPTTTEMPRQCVHGLCSSINKPLAIQKQTTSTSPEKPSQNKQHRLACPLNQSQMSPQKLFLSFLSAPLHPIAHSPLLFPPHSLSCLCRRLVLGSRDLVLLSSLRLSLCLLSLSFPFFSVRRVIVLSSGHGPALTHPPAAFTIVQGEKLDPHGRCHERSTSCRITSSRSACPSDVMAIFEIHATACLSN